MSCNNCGKDSHCGTRTTRTEHMYPAEGGEEYEIEVCKECRCEECS